MSRVVQIGAARALVCIALLAGCAGLRGQRWTERVALIADSAPPEIVVENPQARIACPMSAALAYAEHPAPLTPRQREIAATHPDAWADFWRDYAAELEMMPDNQVYRPSRSDEIKDFLHAGLCQVVDLRTNRPQEEILVVVTHDRARKGGGGSREFRFQDGTAFLGAIDWLP